MTKMAKSEEFSVRRRELEVKVLNRKLTALKIAIAALVTLSMVFLGLFVLAIFGVSLHLWQTVGSAVAVGFPTLAGVGITTIAWTNLLLFDRAKIEFALADATDKYEMAMDKLSQDLANRYKAVAQDLLSKGDV